MSAENGKKIVLGIGAYLILKSVLNLILGFSTANVVYLILFVVFAVLLVMHFRGLPSFSPLLFKGFLAIVFLMNIGNNLANIGGNWIYLVEGLLDVGCAALLVLQKDVRAYFK